MPRDFPSLFALPSFFSLAYPFLSLHPSAPLSSLTSPLASPSYSLPSGAHPFPLPDFHSLPSFPSHFLPRDAIRRARLCHSKSSVRPSVCPSVTSRCVFHTGWNISKIISRPNRLRYLHTLTQTRAIWCNGNTPKIRGE